MNHQPRHPARRRRVGTMFCDYQTLPDSTTGTERAYR
jgi:ABC-type ATPase involved in cell division